MRRKNQLKNVLALVLTFVMCITSIPTTAFATEVLNNLTVYSQVTSAADLTSGGDFVLAVQTDSGFIALDSAALGGKTAGTPVSIENGMVTSEGAPVWTLEACGEGVSIGNGTGYLAYGSSTSFSSAAEPYVWTVAENGAGGFLFVASSANRGILYQKGEVNKFGAYATSNASNASYIANVFAFKASVTGGEGGAVTPTTCDTVTASVAASAVEAGTMVTLSCATEGADIFYNFDGSENYIPYTDAIGINEATTIYAYASKEGLENSSISSFAYTIKEPVTVISIAEAKALAVNTENVMVQGTVVFIDGKNVYVEDATGAINLYFSSAPSGLSLGDVITATGKRAAYKGLEQLSGVTSYEKVDSASVPSTTVTIADILADATVGALECRRVYIENVVIGAINTSGKTTLTQGETQIDIYKIPELTGITKGATVNLYAVVSDVDGYQLRVASATDVTKVSDGTGEEEEEAGELQSGSYVIWASAYNKALSSVYGGYYNNGVDVILAGTQLTGYSDAEIWTVTRNEDDTYYISKDSHKIGMGAANSSMPLDAVNDKWVLEDAGDGKYYVKNVGRACYMEWFSNKGYWSGYSRISSGSEGMFALTFTPVEKRYHTDSSVVETIAQWGGGGPYDQTANARVINGDKYELGDQKDTNVAYTIVANGAQAQPYTSSVSSNTGGTNYYMGGSNIGKAANDYMQFALNTTGYGAMHMSFRLRVTAAAPGSFQLQYSADNGATFKNFTTGEYSYAYTAYNSEGSQEMTGSGAIADGIAVPSKATAQYVKFNFDVPVGAENAEKVLIRLVAGTTRADGKTSAISGTVRIDSVVFTGSPIVDDSITGYVKVDPDGKEEDQAVGTELTMTSATAGATITYRFIDSDGNGEWQTYSESAKPVLPATLPAILEVKASAEGKADSITRMFVYAAGSVSPVKMTPNGGGVYISGEATDVTLSCDTQGAVIYYQIEGEGEFVPYTEPITLRKGFGRTIIKAYAVKEGFKDSAVVTRTFTERNNDAYNIYFGQLHSHTSYSDGAGSAEDAYQHATQVRNLDFLAVTDHSNSFDSADAASIADGSMSSEWVEGHALAEQYTTDEFVGLFGYEMTWSNGLGHINTFNTPGFQSRTQKEYSTYATALQNYYAALKTQTDSISQFNHPGTTFGDFSDFAYYDEEIDNLITIIEVGNGEGAIGSSGYFPSYEYYTRALDKGWHVAPTNNQDNHKGLWGDANTGRSVVLADSLSQDDIYDAMRNYRVYATEDNDLSIMYTLDDNIMGTIMDKSDVGANVTLKVALTDPTDQSIGKVEVIVNGGLSIAAKNVSDANETVNFVVPSDYSYYYIRVTEADGDIAVTAPVWVGDVEAVGITGLSTTNALPTQNQAIDLTLDLYNNESKDLDIESIVFTIDDEVIHTADLTNLSKVGKKSTASYTFSYTHTGLGQTNIYATVKGNLDGVEKVYNEVLKLNYVSPAMVTKVIIDGTHYNDYVTGYYGGNMNNFTTIAANKMVEVSVVTDEITDEMLNDCSLLVVSAPARNSGTANAGDYVAASFDDEFIATVKRYVENGGNVAVCGLADYQDTKAASTDGHISAQINKLLDGIGATLRINDDEAYDETHNGGQAYRLYPETFNPNSRWTANIVEGQKYSQYSGCTVNIADATANDVVSAAEWIVKGFDTTFSVDSDRDGKGSLGESFTTADGKYTYNKVVGDGDAVFIASQDTVYGGTIFAAGGVFISDFEVKAELDNIWDLPYANRTIAENILDKISVELPLSTIAEMRAGNYKDVFRIQGYATAGRVDGNAFFDAMYIQDETAGITVFPIAEDGLQLGTKMEIVGYLDQYQGDREIQVMSYKILDEEPYLYEPQRMTAAEAMNYERSGGKLVRMEGRVVDVLYDANGTGVSQFWIDDGSGTIGNVFVDGYILSATTGRNELASVVRVGATVSAVGLVYAHPEGNSDVPVTCLRVRNCDEIVAVSGADTENPDNGNTDTENPDNGNTDNGNPDNGNTDNGNPDNGNTDSGNPDNGNTDSGNPDNGNIDSGNPDNGNIDNGNTDNGDSNSGSSNNWSSPAVTIAQTNTANPTNDRTGNRRERYADNTISSINRVTIEEEGDWNAVAEAIETIAAGGEIYLSLGENAIVSGDVISSMRGRDVYLVLTLENGVVWTIYGNDIVDEEIADIDLAVELQINVIPEDMIASVAGENSTLGISLKHNGAFGFKAYLTITVGEKYANNQAELYYYNPTTDALELQYTGTVTKDGTLEMLFSHASDYVVVFEVATAEDTDVAEEKTQTTDAAEIVENNKEDSGNTIPIIVIILLLIAAIAVIVVLGVRKRKNIND